MKPGPAEALFGITAAPMTAVADWHGRISCPDLNLRGDISQACSRLSAAYRGFDRKKAARPPFKIPPWAEPLVGEGGLNAMKSILDRVHPREGEKPDREPTFKEFITLYRSLDLIGPLIQFCNHYFAACEDRTPPHEADYPGYLEEVALLEEMTFARNDSIKFKAISAFGKFAPLEKISFLAARAEEKGKECSNPNIILCRSLEAVGDMAARFPGVTDRSSAMDRKAILKTLPWLIRVLDHEGRNNSACSCARTALERIMETTGAPEALEAYLHNFKSPNCDSQWMIDYTDRYHEKTLERLRHCTGQDLGKKFKAWKKWYDKNESKLYYNPETKTFVLDAQAARAFRSKVR